MREPDFERAYRKANEALVRTKSIQGFPYPIRELVREMTGARCRTFERARKRGVEIKDFGSDSAIVMRKQGKWIIFYNEAESISRIRFSLAHETGHIVLEHDLECGDNELYGVYEVEANYLAAQLLMPEQLLRYLQKFGVPITESLLMDQFGVSREAAQKRLNTLTLLQNVRRSHEEKEFDDIILTKYVPFIQPLCPARHDYYDFESEYERDRERSRWLQDR